MTPKAARLADTDKGATELDILMTGLYGQDWVPEGNGLNLSDEEHREWEARQMERIYSEIAKEQETHREAFQTLQKVRRVLREFAKAPVTISSLQPVLELAHDLNPSLRDELNPEPSPFI